MQLFIKAILAKATWLGNLAQGESSADGCKVVKNSDTSKICLQRELWIK